MKLNIVVVGVGGQGLITLATVLAECLAAEGFNVVTAETHGMSQRGGSVIVHVRAGDVEAPLVPLHGANLMLAAELIEAVRYSTYLSRGSVVVANDYLQPPPGATPPDKSTLIGYLSKVAKLELVPATSVAERIGDPRVANMVLLGYATARGHIPVKKETLVDVVKRFFGAKASENLRAVEEGYKLAEQATV